MKSSSHLITGSKVVLSHDLQTESGRFWHEGTEGVVDAIWRKDGKERIYVKLDGVVLVVDKSVLEDAPVAADTSNPIDVLKKRVEILNGKIKNWQDAVFEYDSPLGPSIILKLTAEKEALEWALERLEDAE